MKQFLNLFLAVLLLLLAGNAFAVRQASDYYGFHVGASQAETIEITSGPLQLVGDFGTGMNADLVLGHDYGDIYKNLGFRIEGMFSWMSPDTDVNAFSAMANLNMDFYNKTKFTPYLSGGAGIGWVRYEIGIPSLPISAKQDGYGFAWQGGAGVSYEISRFVNLELGYRFFSIDSADLGSGTESKFSTHNYVGGARFFW